MRKVFVTGGSGFLGKSFIRMLIAKHISVHALVRSDKSEMIVRNLGAIAVRGDLFDKKSLMKGLAGIDVVFHIAARTFRQGGSGHDYYEDNVTGTENILEASKEMGVKKLVFVSSETVLLGDKKIINADEDWPVPDKHFAIYDGTKAMAERKVLGANSQKLQTVVIRPRNIWSEESEALSKIADLAKTGKFLFIDHGRYPTSTCHVENVCEALILAAERGRGGQVYFVTDGKPIEMGKFINNILAAKNIPPVEKSIPHWLAWQVACFVELVWKISGIKNSPPISRATIKMLGEEVTINDAKARRELGYKGKVSIEEGIRRFRSSN